MLACASCPGVSGSSTERPVSRTGEDDKRVGGREHRSRSDQDGRSANLRGVAASGAKRPFIRKQDIAVDNESVEDYPVSNRQGDRKKPCQSVRRGQGVRREAFVEYSKWNHFNPAGPLRIT